MAHHSPLTSAGPPCPVRFLAPCVTSGFLAGRHPRIRTPGPRCRRLEGWGLRVVRGRSAEAQTRFLAGDDAARLADFHELLRNPRVDVLMASRGGFGCTRLFDQLDWELLAANTKPVVGYSDLTALHLACYKAGCCSGLSGPMVAVELARNPQPPQSSRPLFLPAISG